MTKTSTKSYINIITREFTELIKQAQTSKKTGWQFKVNNYRKVINIISTINSNNIGNLCDIDITSCEQALDILREGGMGFKNEKPPKWKSQILLKIQEILENGYLKTAESARNDPKTQALNILTTIPEIGPSKALQLYDSGITTIAQLLANPELVNRKQQIGLRHYKDLSERIPRQEMDRWYQDLSDIISEILNTMEINYSSMSLVGSYRRGMPNSGDIDYYISISDGQSLDYIITEICDALVDNGALNRDDIFSAGSHKLMCVAKLGEAYKARHLDIFIFHESQYPFALMYATGSGEFNVRFRNHALQMGWSLSDKAICKGEAGGLPPTHDELFDKIGKYKITSEQDIFRFMGIQYIEPEDRTPTVKFKLIADIIDNQ